MVLNEKTLTNFAITMNNMRTVSEQAMGTMSDINAIVATNGSQVSLAVSNVLFFSQELTRTGRFRQQPAGDERRRKSAPP